MDEREKTQQELLEEAGQLRLPLYGAVGEKTIPGVLQQEPGFSSGVVNR